MSVNIPIGFAQQYTTNVQLLLQQKMSRLRGAVMTESFKGKSAKSIEQIGAVTAQLRTTRHQDTPLIDTPHAARWIFPSDFEWADLIDGEDKLRMIWDPQSPYAQNGASALGRVIDDVIIAAADGTNFVGENGTTTEPFDAAWNIASGTVGLTVAKLRQAKRMLLAAENNPDEEYFCVVSADQIEDLLGETLATSIDYNQVKPLASGEVVRFMGFTFIHSERIRSIAGEDAVLAFPRSGLMLGIWNDVQTIISDRPDKGHATQVYVAGTFGASRTHTTNATLGKVVRIMCVP